MTLLTVSTGLKNSPKTKFPFVGQLDRSTHLDNESNPVQNEQKAGAHLHNIKYQA